MSMNGVKIIQNLHINTSENEFSVNYYTSEICNGNCVEIAFSEKYFEQKRLSY